MSFRDPAAVFAWADSFTNLERNLPPLDKRTWRLDRMRRMLDDTDSPDTAFRSFHVAGSKGKGSTAALMAASLAASGRRTGLYTSPHVSDWIERIAIDGAPAAAVLVTAAGDRARALVEHLADSLPGGFAPTTFELLTLIAFLCFRDAGCEDAVVEVGIGGRLDVTNVISPEASVVTPLDLEHTDILGDTIEEIAAEKAGIIKQGVPVFVAGRPPGTKDIFRRAAAEHGAPLAFLDEEAEVGPVVTGPGGTSFTVRLRGERPVTFSLAMPGTFQADNAALAYLCLHRCRPAISEAAFRAGFAAARLPGRIEIVPSNPPVVLDGAHTPLAVTRLLETFRQIYPDGGVLLFGSVSGKKPQEMAEILAPAFSSIVVSKPNAFKPSDPAGVWAIFHRLNPRTELHEDPDRALARARELAGGRPILVTGSFYMVSEIRALLGAET
jgi:dihydrofolate synthase/folylpolyglutamate synthase